MNNMELLADALSYIELNLCETITAESVARNCFCSKSGLEKLFRNVYHYGVKEYVIKKAYDEGCQGTGTVSGSHCPGYCPSLQLPVT